MEDRWFVDIGISWNRHIWRRMRINSKRQSYAPCLPWYNLYDFMDVSRYHRPRGQTIPEKPQKDRSVKYTSVLYCKIKIISFAKRRKQVGDFSRIIKAQDVCSRESSLHLALFIDVAEKSYLQRVFIKRLF